MPIFIPAVLIGAGVASGLGGAVNVVRGVQKMRQAGTEVEKAKARYDKALKKTQDALETTNKIVRAYGEQQEASHRQVVGRMASFLRRHEQTVSERAAELFDGIAVETQSVGFSGTRISADGLVGSFAGTAVAGAATYTGIPGAVATLGSASTGTAIGTLSGAAAQNATLAWLGGGSIASGGGGMAMGALALNFVTIGPTILVGGFFLNGQGEKAKTKARRYCAEVERSIDEQRKLRSRLRLIETRVGELEGILGQLTDRGIAALDELEGNEPFDPQAHAEPFRRALAYAIAVRDVVSIPLLDDDGTLDPETERLVITYRGMQ